MEKTKCKCEKNPGNLNITKNTGKYEKFNESIVEDYNKCTFKSLVCLMLSDRISESEGRTSRCK